MIKLNRIWLKLDSIKKEAIDIYGDHFDQKKSFFFESLEGDKNWSRYTIIGCSSGDYLEEFGNKIKKYSNFLEEKILTAAFFCDTYLPNAAALKSTIINTYKILSIIKRP